MWRTEGSSSTMRIFPLRSSLASASTNQFDLQELCQRRGFAQDADLQRLVRIDDLESEERKYNEYSLAHSDYTWRDRLGFFLMRGSGRTRIEMQISPDCGASDCLL